MFLLETSGALSGWLVGERCSRKNFSPGFLLLPSMSSTLKTFPRSTRILVLRTLTHWRFTHPAPRIHAPRIHSLGICPPAPDPRAVHPQYGSTNCGSDDRQSATKITRSVMFITLIRTNQMSYCRTYPQIEHSSRQSVLPLHGLPEINISYAKRIHRPMLLS